MQKEILNFTNAIINNIEIDVDENNKLTTTVKSKTKVAFNKRNVVIHVKNNSCVATSYIYIS